jgi:hypothetical protein
LLRREVVNLLRRQVVSLNRREVVSLTVFSNLQGSHGIFIIIVMPMLFMIKY